MSKSKNFYNKLNKFYELKLQSSNRLNKKVKIIERWKYNVFLFCFYFALISFTCVFIVVGVSAQKIDVSPLNVYNGIISINILHKISLTPATENFINKTLGEYLHKTN